MYVFGSGWRGWRGGEWMRGSVNPKKVYRGWGREGSTQFAKLFVTAVIAPPLVGCVVWSYHCSVDSSSF